MGIKEMVSEPLSNVLDDIYRKVTGSRENSGHLCHYGLVTESGKSGLYLRQACFYKLRDNFVEEEFSQPFRSDPLKFFVFSHRNGVSEEVAIKWVDYLANRSQFASCFESKDAEEIVKNAAILNTKFHAAVVIAAATFDRYRVENPTFVDQWAKLVELGVGEDEALLFAHFVLLEKDGFQLLPHNPPNSNHFAFIHPITFNCRQRIAESFLKGDFNTPSDVLFKYNTHYSGINDLWTPAGGLGKNISNGSLNKFTEDRKKTVPFRGEVTIKNIPFGRIPEAVEAFFEDNEIER